MTDHRNCCCAETLDLLEAAEPRPEGHHPMTDQTSPRTEVIFLDDRQPFGTGRGHTTRKILINGQEVRVLAGSVEVKYGPSELTKVTLTLMVDRLTFARVGDPRDTQPQDAPENAQEQAQDATGGVTPHSDTPASSETAEAINAMRERMRGIMDGLDRTRAAAKCADTGSEHQQ